MTKVQPVIVQPGAGRELHAFGSILSVMLGGAQTGRALTVILDTTLPGGGPPPHVHANEDELFLVVEGCISYQVNDQWTEVGAGGVVYLPRGTIHSFRNVGTTPSKHWVVMTPSGCEKFFARCAEEFQKPGGPDMHRIAAISHEHGLEFFDPAHTS